MNRIVRLAIACAAGALLAGVALAHDFWIEPPKFRVAKGETVDVPLRVGMEYAGDPVPRDDLRIEKFVMLGPDGVETVTGANREDPAGRVTPGKDGIYVVAYKTKGLSIEIEAAKFEAYLKEEGLEHVSKVRAERKETDKAGSELYSRCAKALLRAGEGAKDGHDRVAGLILEIVPRVNPYLMAAGDELSFKVLYAEKPLENGLVVARSRAEPKHVVSARTDARGGVTLKLDRAGAWLVKCTHMVPARRETGMDWESFWASLTFDLAR